MRNETQKPAEEAAAQESKPEQITYDEGGGRYVAFMLIGFGLLLAAAIWVGMAN